MDTTTDFRCYYDLESYLFSKVRPRFHDRGVLDAFDFFCIIIWKANRAKSTIARNLLRRGYSSLDEAVHALTNSIAREPNLKAKLTLLLDDWGFRLPMASAILTVLYPDHFTIYDTRVCNAIHGFHLLANVTNSDRIWEQYLQFKDAVANSAPEHLSLRDKDRFLWGRSFGDQLAADIKNSFSHES